MNPEIDFPDIVEVRVFPDNSAEVAPGTQWNTFVETIKGDDEKLRAMGAVVACTAGVAIHSGMIESTTNAFVRAADPSFTPPQEKVFREGSQSQATLMRHLDMARGGRL